MEMSTTPEPTPEQTAEVLAFVNDHPQSSEAELRNRCACRSDQANAICPLHN